MDCTAAGPLLAAHGDSALGPVDRAAMQSHLASCESCRTRAGDVTDRVGRLEAVLAGYRVREAAVEPHLEAARAAMAGRVARTDLGWLWVLLVIGIPALVDLFGVVLTRSLGWNVWWWPGSDGFERTGGWMVATGVPASATALLLVAWRRLRSEHEAESPESLLLAAAAGAAALLAWWPTAGVLVEGLAARTAWGVGREDQVMLAHVHLIMTLVALVIAVIVAGPMMLRPARRVSSVTPGLPGRDAVRGRLLDAMRLVALACFERAGDLMESLRLAEEALPETAARLGVANAPGVTLRSWTQGIAAQVTPEAEAAPERATARLGKVLERRELEAALHGLEPNGRAVSYLRLVQQLPLPRTQALLAVEPAAAARGLAEGLEALGAFARRGSDERT